MQSAVASDVAAPESELRPKLEKYTSNVHTLLQKYVEFLFSRDGNQRRGGHRKPQTPFANIAQDRRNRLLAGAVGRRINWNTWLKLCDGDVDVAIYTILLRHLGSSTPKSIESCSDLGLFKISRRGYNRALQQHIIGKFGIDVDQLDKFSFAAITNLRDLVTWYVTFLYDLKLLELPAVGQPIRICMFMDANSKSARLKINGFFLHFLDVPECGAAYSYLPFLLQIGQDCRSSVEKMLRRRAAPPLRCVEKKVKSGKFRMLRDCVSNIGARTSLLKSVVIDGRCYEILLGGVADFHAFVGFFTLEDVCNANVAFPQMKRSGQSRAFNQGLDCAWLTGCPCPTCRASPFIIFSEKTDFAILDEPPNTVFDGMSAKHVMEGILHAVQSVFGFCRDLLVVCAFLRHGKETVVARAFASFNFGPGFDWRFGTDANTGVPLDPDHVAMLQKEYQTKQNAKKPPVAIKKGPPRGRCQAKKKVVKSDDAAFRFRARPLEQGKGMELQFRPEYNKILDFFGIGWDDKDAAGAPWMRAFFALKSFQSPYPEQSPIKGAHDALANLHDWIAEVRKPMPNSRVVKTTGHAVWTYWNRMLHTAFPCDPSRFHPDLRRDNKIPLYDKRRFAIGYGSHCALVHAWQWVDLWTAKFFPRAIETGGEHTLYLSALLMIHLKLRNVQTLDQPGYLLYYAIALVMAKALRAAQARLCDLKLMDVALSQAASSVFLAAAQISADTVDPARLKKFDDETKSLATAAKAAGCAARAISDVEKRVKESKGNWLPHQGKSHRAPHGLRVKSGPHNGYVKIKPLPPVREEDWKDFGFPFRGCMRRRAAPYERIAEPCAASLPSFNIQELGDPNSFFRQAQSVKKDLGRRSLRGTAAGAGSSLRASGKKARGAAAGAAAKSSRSTSFSSFGTSSGEGLSSTSSSASTDSSTDSSETSSSESDRETSSSTEGESPKL